MNWILQQPQPSPSFTILCSTMYPRLFAGRIFLPSSPHLRMMIREYIVEYWTVRSWVEQPRRSIRAKPRVKDAHLFLFHATRLHPSNRGDDTSSGPGRDCKKILEVSKENIWCTECSTPYEYVKQSLGKTECLVARSSSNSNSPYNYTPADAWKKNFCMSSHRIPTCHSHVSLVQVPYCYFLGMYSNCTCCNVVR
jgi:hypothetical protein